MLDVVTNLKILGFGVYYVFVPSGCNDIYGCDVYFYFFFYLFIILYYRCIFYI